MNSALEKWFTNELTKDKEGGNVGLLNYCYALKFIGQMGRLQPSDENEIMEEFKLDEFPSKNVIEKFNDMTVIQEIKFLEEIMGFSTTVERLEENLKVMNNRYMSVNLKYFGVEEKDINPEALEILKMLGVK